MTRTISRLFESHTEAMAAVERIEASGVEPERISLIANNADGWHNGHHHADGAKAGPGDFDRDGKDNVVDGLGKGASAGAFLGGGAGALAGLGMLAIPGLGPVVAAGWLVSATVGAALGAAAGSATGGLLGALKEAGHDDDEAHAYAEGVRRGATLVSVKADDDEAAGLETLLGSHNGVDAATRSQAWREEGWSAFDETAQPYSSDQVAAERRRYAEVRSFAGSTDLDDDAAAEPTRGGRLDRDGTGPARGL